MKWFYKIGWRIYLIIINIIIIYKLHSKSFHERAEDEFSVAGQ